MKIKNKDKNMIKNASAILSCLAIISTFILANAALGEEAVDLSKLSGICAEKPLSEPLQKAVSSMKYGINRLYGIKLEPLKIPPESTNAVYLGKAAIKKGLISESELKTVSPDGFVIKCSNGKVAICGASQWATLYGVGAFFEKLGVKMKGLFLSQAKFPENPNPIVAPFSISSKPAFAYRNGMSFMLGETFYELADAKKGANPELFDRKKTGSDLWIDHTAGYLVPKLMYYDKHPEYYAMKKDGKRIEKNRFTDHRTPLCLSNPDVTKISIDRALKWVEKNKDKKFFLITYGDTRFWCQCPECKKLDPVEGEYMTRLLHWVNSVAKAVGEKYPDKIIFTFAYAGSDKVPPKARPEKNVWIMASTGSGNIPFWDHSQKQKTKHAKANWAKLDGWLKATPRSLLVCEYLSNFYQPAFIDQTASRYRSYARKGIRGILFSYGRPANFPEVWVYLHGKLLWNPDIDALQTAKDIANSIYGKGGKAIGEYFDLVHKRYQKTLEDNDKLVDSYPQNFYTLDFIKKACECFDKADAATKDAPKINKKIAKEKALFLEDSLKHLPSYKLDDNNKALISFVMDQLLKSARKSGKFVDFARKLDITARNLAKENTEILPFIRNKLGKTEEFKPEKTNDGLRFSPAMYLGADYGPKEFTQRESHKTLPCPPKLCAGVKAKAKDSRGNWTSSEMKLVFDLDSVPGDGAAKLDLEGQDAVSKWAGKRQLPLMTHMLIKINGHEIYKGECGFVRGNWSRRVFDIPAGILKKGKNEIMIKNITKDTRGPFAACWALISDTKLRFDNK